MEHPPEYFEKLLENPSDIDKMHVKTHIQEIEKTLASLQKGIDMLTKMGRKPENKVLENQKRFLNALEKLKKLS